ncbi:UNVERIFIED_CONTAM: hypothetical protein RMT77_008872 [Armadillidium vulgare]
MFERNAISWPVNIEMIVDNKSVPIKDRKFDKLNSLITNEGKESHLLFINRYSSNKSSTQMEEITYVLLKIFQKTIYKFDMMFENNHHIK